MPPHITARCYASAVLAMARYGIMGERSTFFTKKTPSISFPYNPPLVLAMALCLSVSVSACVRPTEAGVLLKRQNVGSHKQDHTIAQGL